MDRFGRFRNLEELGEGGSARVYRAWDPAHQHHVALKIPRRTLLSDQRSRDRFLWEAWALQRLRHPNIVQVYEAGDVSGRPYLAMELLAGPSLAERAPGRAWPLADVARWAEQIAAAIDAAHAAGIVHGDIKPGNLLFAADGRLVLTDFGIGRLLDDGDPTVTATIVGTLRYLAPERWAGARPAPPADLYAFGVLLYEQLAGVPPFHGDLVALARAHQEQEPVALTELRPDLPPIVWAVLAPALAKDPAARPAWATAVAASLALAASAETADAIGDADRTEQIPLDRLRSASPPTAPAWGPPETRAARRARRIQIPMREPVALILLLAGIGAALALLYPAGSGTTAGNGAPPPAPVAAGVAQPATTPAPTATAAPAVAATPAPPPRVTQRPGSSVTPRPAASPRPTVSPRPVATPRPRRDEPSRITVPPPWVGRR